jgi:hypothetical protein
VGGRDLTWLVRGHESEAVGGPYATEGEALAAAWEIAAESGAGDRAEVFERVPPKIPPVTGPEPMEWEGARPDFMLVDEPVWARSPPMPDDRRLGARLVISDLAMIRDANGAAEDVVERLHRELTRRADEEGMVLVGRPSWERTDERMGTVITMTAMARPVSQTKGAVR